MRGVRRIHDLPWQTPGFTLIRSRQFCICLFYSHCADERHPALMHSRLAKGNLTVSANTAERGPLKGVFADRGAATRGAINVAGRRAHAEDRRAGDQLFPFRTGMMENVGMKIHLPPELEEIVKQERQRGPYHTVDEVVEQVSCLRH